MKLLIVLALAVIAAVAVSAAPQGAQILPVPSADLPAEEIQPVVDPVASDEADEESAQESQESAEDTEDDETDSSNSAEEEGSAENVPLTPEEQQLVDDMEEAVGQLQTIQTRQFPSFGGSGNPLQGLAQIPQQILQGFQQFIQGIANFGRPTTARPATTTTTAATTTAAAGGSSTAAAGNATTTAAPPAPGRR